MCHNDESYSSCSSNYRWKFVRLLSNLQRCDESFLDTAVQIVFSFSWKVAAK